MLSIKPSANLHGLRPELVLAAIIAHQVYSDMGADCVITSALDGPHTAHSLHGLGYALDFRTKNVPVEKHQAITSELAARLGPQYDVALEVDHIHIEFDPR